MRKHLESCDTIELEHRADNSVINSNQEPSESASTSSSQSNHSASASTSSSQPSYHSETLSIPSHQNVVHQNRMENFVVKTTRAEKEKLDEQAARFFYAANLSFLKVEGKEFKSFCNKLRPGYTPPSSKQLSNELLDTVYEKEILNARTTFKDSIVTLAVDG